MFECDRPRKQQLQVGRTSGVSEVAGALWEVRRHRRSISFTSFCLDWKTKNISLFDYFDSISLHVLCSLSEMGLEDSLANVRRSVDASRAQRFSGSIRQKAVRSLQKERKVSWKTLAVQVAAHACLHALPYGKGFGRSLAAAVQRWDSATGVADLNNARASKKRFGPSFVSISIRFLQVIWLFHHLLLLFLIFT